MREFQSTTTYAYSSPDNYALFSLKFGRSKIVNRYAICPFATVYQIVVNMDQLDKLFHVVGGRGIVGSTAISAKGDISRPGLVRLRTPNSRGRELSSGHAPTHDPATSTPALRGGRPKVADRTGHLNRPTKICSPCPTFTGLPISIQYRIDQCGIGPERCTHVEPLPHRTVFLLPYCTVQPVDQFSIEQ